MENLSLYDILVGCFPSEWPGYWGDPSSVSFAELENLPEDRKLRLSITENLRMILQARCDTGQNPEQRSKPWRHLPDFGIPDILQVYFESGGTIEPIKARIRDTILKFEPRISDVKIQKDFFDPNNMRISLHIIATIKDASQRETLLTEFSTTGWTKVVFERDVE